METGVRRLATHQRRRTVLWTRNAPWQLPGSGLWLVREVLAGETRPFSDRNPCGMQTSVLPRAGGGKAHLGQRSREDTRLFCHCAWTWKSLDKACQLAELKKQNKKPPKQTIPKTLGLQNHRFLRHWVFKTDGFPVRFQKHR